MFVYNENMLFQGSAFDIALSIFLGCAGVMALAAGVQGYIIRHINWLQRIGAIVGGLLLIAPGYVTDISGLVLIAIVLITAGLFKGKPEKLEAK